MAVFLHIGSGKSIKTGDIVGIFDMDTSTVSRVTRGFLNESQKKEELSSVTADIPKSFIVVNKKINRVRKEYKERAPKVIISQLAVQTLYERQKRKI